MSELEVSRILGSSTHYQVLGFEQSNQAPNFVDSQQIRRRYKELAILVHPDKNRAIDAEAAFKRLSEAYECLVDAISQHNYLQQLQARSKTGSKAPNHKFNYKRKRKTESKTKTEAKPRKRRTPEEVWQQFQQEEEELARQQFHAKGFDRIYELKRPAESDDASATLIPSEQQQNVLNSNLDAKASKWMAWSKPTSKRMRTELSTLEPAHEVLLDIDGTSLICCLLCRRKFATVEALARHEKLSKLHLANIQKSGDFP